jgi:hypothetical protein
MGTYRQAFAFFRPDVLRLMTTGGVRSMVSSEANAAHRPRSGHTGISSILPEAEGREQPHGKDNMIDNDTRGGPMKGV